MTAAPIGFIGVGVMGSAIAHRLLDAGYELSIYNRSSHRLLPLLDKGATALPTPAEVAHRCEHIVSCLLDTAAVEDVCFGPAGLVDALRPGHVLVEHATFSAATARRIAAGAEARGAHFLDAPITGGPEGATAGTLTTMVGGAARALETVSGLLAHYTNEILHVGESGRGLELKLVNQLLVSCHLVAAAEASVLIDSLRLPPDISQQALMSGWAASTMLAHVLPRAAVDDYTSRGATIGGLIEVQRLVADLARDHRLDLRLFAATRSIFAQATSAGLAEYDPAALTHNYRHSRAATSADAEVAT